MFAERALEGCCRRDEGQDRLEVESQSGPDDGDVVLLHLGVALDELDSLLNQLEIGLERSHKLSILDIRCLAILQLHRHLGQMLDVLAFLLHVGGQLFGQELLAAEPAQEQAKVSPSTQSLLHVFQS